MPTARLMIVARSYREARGLSLLLLLEESAEVVGWATDAEEALERIGQLRPDMVLVEHVPGESDGIELAGRLREASPRSRTVIMSPEAPLADAPRAREAGIDGWLAGELPPAILLDELRGLLLTLLPA